MDVRISGLFYRVVVQSILLYRSKTWVLTASMLAVLEGTHVRFSRVLTRMIPSSTGGGGWTYPLTADILKAAGFQTVDMCIKRQQNTMVDWVATQLVLELCLRMGALAGGGWKQKKWWDQVIPLQCEGGEWQYGGGGNRDGDRTEGENSKEINGSE